MYVLRSCSAVCKTAFCTTVESHSTVQEPLLYYKFTSVCTRNIKFKLLVCDEDYIVPPVLLENRLKTAEVVVLVCDEARFTSGQR